MKKDRKIERKKKLQGKNIMSASATQGGHKDLLRRNDGGRVYGEKDLRNRSF